MDDMTAFERQVAGEFVRRAGPVRPVDATAIFTAITATQSPRWRFQSTFSATKFVVAAAIVGLFSGFLLAGLLTQPSDDPAPAAVSVSPSPTTTDGLFSSMDNVEVEPGVYRVDSDGIRSLARPMGTARPSWDIHRGMEGAIAAGPDGSVWWFGQDGFFRLGEPEVHAWPGGRDDTFLYREGMNPSSLTVDFEVGPDGSVWLARSAWDEDLSDDDTTVAVDEVLSFDGMSWSAHERIPAGSEVIGVEVRADGDVWAAWVSYTPREHVTVARLGDAGWEALPDASSSDGVGLSVAYSGRDGVWLVPGSGQPLLRYDGSSWQELPIPGAEGEVQADVGPDGTVWVRLDPACRPNCRASRSNMLARLDGTDWEIFDAADSIPIIGGHQMLHPGFFEAAPDGSVWFDPTVPLLDASTPQEEIVATDCDGVATFDGEAVTRYLRGMCIYSMDVAPDGAVWVQGRMPTDDDARLIDTYVITPKAVAAGE